MAKGSLDISLRIGNDWNKLVLDIKELAKRAPAATAYVIYNHLGKYVLRRSQELVPIDTGALRSTGILRPPNKANDYTTTVSYGGILPSVKTNEGKDEVNYAVKVHEATGVKFNHGKVALYLQRAASVAIATRGSEASLSLAIQKAIDDKVRVAGLKDILGSASSPHSGSVWHSKKSSRKYSSDAKQKPSRSYRMVKGGK